MDVAVPVHPQLLDEDPPHSDNSDEAAWVDSDDERLTITLASNPRLRKLRISESENMINGKEYVKRLRRQFERLYPAPDWADRSIAKYHNHQKRRRASSSSDSSEAAVSGDDITIGSEELAAPPLARLLQNSGGFAQPVPNASSQKRKLRPDFIDMHRSKDIGISQPVS